MTGDTVPGAMIFEFFSPGTSQILANAGCDYVIYDMEHAGLGFETLKWLVASARGLPIAQMVRVPRGDYHFIARALDVGARGVMVPMVESAEAAHAIAEASQYPPLGRRGAAFGFAHDGYRPGPPADKIAHANAERIIIAQIETEHGLANVDAIAAVPGIDVLWVGHFDLTNFLGIPGQFDNPKFTDALECVVAAGRRHGKGLGFLAADPATARTFRARGFNMLAAGTDMALLASGVNAILSAMR
jgi:2-dehydro-3-deoxyglucarate aldolase/4-hydroxy-2-oxoheptanedioate aldolase